MRRIPAIVFRILALAAAVSVAAGNAAAEAVDPPHRVVSLSPAATELVVRLGAAELLVGRTRYCETPEAAGVAIVGGITDPSLETIAGLEPDLVILTELTPSEFEERIQLVAPGANILRLQYNSWASLLEGIATVGRLLQRDAAAAELISEFEAAEAAVRQEPLPPLRVLVLYGHLETVAAGRGTFPDELLSRLGFENVAAAPTLSKWPKLSMEYILATDPNLLIVSDGVVDRVSLADEATLAQYRGNVVWRNLAAVRNGAILLVPSSRLSIPDSHLAETLLQIHTVAKDLQ